MKRSLSIPTKLGRGVGFLLVATLLVSAIGGAAAAGGLNFTSGKAPNPQFTVDSVSVATWNNSAMDSPTQYYDDSGNIASLPGHVNKSSNVDDLGNGTVNPITVTATDWNVADFSAFPHGQENTSALDASQWTTSGASVTNTSTAPDVTAINYAGAASSDNATLSGIGITSDAQKRFVQIAADVNSATGTPTLKLYDSDGDYVTVDLYNSSANNTAAGVLANSTGEGQVLQTRIGDLPVKGSGDGTMTGISKAVITGQANVDISLLNADKKSRYVFGKKMVKDGNSLTSQTIYEPHGAYSVYSVDTFGPAFADATVHGLSMPMVVDAAALSSQDVNATFSTDNAYPQWDSVASIYYRLNLPAAYDLTYSGVSLTQTTQWPGTRYATVKYAEDTGSTAMSNVSSWTTLTSQYDSQDKHITLDSTVSTDTNYVIHYELKLTSNEAAAMQSVAASGGAGILGGSGSGGIIGMIFSLPGMIISALVAFAGAMRLGWV